jgi:hypothetical protein
MKAVITKSDNKKKKYKVIVTDGDKKKTIHFGQAGANDYTITGDDEAKYRYIDRHKKREDWQNPFTAGFWSLHMLWSDKTIKSSLNKIKKNFDIEIINNI